MYILITILDIKYSLLFFSSKLFFENLGTILCVYVIEAHKCRSNESVRSPPSKLFVA